jgi:hypothetical protein
VLFNPELVNLSFKLALHFSQGFPFSERLINPSVLCGINDRLQY